jgi:hypothetical protein
MTAKVFFGTNEQYGRFTKWEKKKDCLNPMSRKSSSRSNI